MANVDMFLMELADINSRIFDETQELQEMKERLTSVGSSSNSSLGSKTQSKDSIGIAITNFVDYENKVIHKIQALLDKKWDMLQILDELPYDECSLAKYCYANGFKTISSYATIKGKSYSWAYKIFQNMRTNLDDILEKKKSDKK